jgi:HNH endonuclease
MSSKPNRKCYRRLLTHDELEGKILSRVVRASTCWVWTGSKNKKGYGHICIGAGQIELAHRTSYRTFCGPIPDGLCVLHHCDNPVCLNPTHLFIGTQIDNINDCVSKGRNRGGGQQGEHHHHAKITDENAKEILELISAGVPLSKIAERFNFSYASVYAIKIGKTWRHVPADFCRAKVKKERDVVCRMCGKVFVGTWNASICSLECRRARWREKSRKCSAK